MGKPMEHYLSSLFDPGSVAVFGASTKPDSVAAVVLNNIVAGGFKGAIYPVNPKYDEVDGITCYKKVADIGQPVDLAIIATPARTVPTIFEECGEAGVKAAIVLSAGFGESGAKGERLQQSIADIARRYGIRFVGPNCLGVIRPQSAFNATFGSGDVTSGNLALVSQSGALCTAILDWAENQDIGFSTVVSMGISVDIDFGEILDYLVADPRTHSILMYVEGVRNARTFMSGLRAAARVKPVIVVKAGRHQASAEAARSHTGALIGGDDVFDAALSRAGVVRGMHIGDLFAAATVLSRGIRLKGEKLALITNGGGPAAMACDKASDLGIPLAQLDESTIEALNSFLPPMWSHGNPVDILGDADPERYRKTVETVLADPDTSGAIILLTPQAMTDANDVAAQVALAGKQSNKPVLTCWMGERQVAKARKTLSDAGVPNFRLPETAVQGFAYLTSFYRNQKLLLQTPAAATHDTKPDLEGARMIINNALNEKRKLLTESESKAILAAFHIPVATTMVATTAIDAVIAAQNIGLPVAMKIHSQQINHKSDIGGVRLNIGSAAAVNVIFNELRELVEQQDPPMAFNGVVVEPMIRTVHGRELLVGIANDPVFGPVITFGSGGATSEVLSDRSVALPPLNRVLASDMISHTRVKRMLGAFRDKPAADLAAIENTLLRVSEIACELPEVMELDINPLIADIDGVTAVDARIRIERHYQSGLAYSHTAIHPYPAHLDKHIVLSSGVTCNVRPIRPEDAEIEKAFVAALSNTAKRYRFMNTFRELPPEMLARFTQIDYDREMALIAVISWNGAEKEIGVARYVMNMDGESCEFAITVADQWQGKGVAQALMDELMDYARYRGLRIMHGEVLAENQKMLSLARKLGFEVGTPKDDHTLKTISRRL